MYAIINTNNNSFVYGTDFNCSPPRPKESTDQALLFSDRDNELGLCELEMKRRHCGDEYKLVKVKLEVIEE